MQAYAGKWALVTGASSGIGEEFARQLAGLGMHTILVARREDRLKQIAMELQNQHRIQTRVIRTDLSADGAVEELVQLLEAEELTVDLLINNAGFGEFGAFASLPVDRCLGMIDLNVRALTELSRRFIEGMVERGTGGIIHVASTSAFQPVPYLSVYAATKAYVLSLSESMWAEVRRHGVTVHCVCPGFTTTEFFDVASMPKSVAFTCQTVGQVVTTTLKAFRKKRPTIVSGWANWFVSLLPRVSARRVVAKVGERMFNPKKHDGAAKAS